MRKTILILSLTTLALLQSCTEKKAVELTQQINSEEKTIRNEKEIYEVVNFCLEIEILKERRANAALPDKLTTQTFQDNPLITAKIESAFPREDLMYVRSQLKNTSLFLLKADELPADIRLIPYDTLKTYSAEAKKTGNPELLFTKLSKGYGNTLMIMSKPIFSKDRTIAVVSFGYSSGPVSNFGHIYTLQRKPEGWKILNVINSWSK